MKKCKFRKSVTAALLAAGLALSEPTLTEVLGYTTSVAFAAAPSVPTISKEPGSYIAFENLLVTFKCDTAGAKIFYKLDNGKYQEFFEPVEISKKTTVYYYSEKNGAKSKVQSAKYELLPDIDILLDIGSTVKASISTPLSGVTCYYTTDGSKPTTKSKIFSGSIKLKKNCTLRVMAKKTGWKTAYFTREITVGKPVYEKNLLTDYTKKYYYNQLNNAEKTAYQRIFNSMMNFEDKADVSDLKLDGMRVWSISSMVLYENPQIFWWKENPSVSCAGDIAYSVNMIYQYTQKEAQKRTKLLEERANDIISLAKKQPNTFLCVKYLHDTLALESYYDGYNGEFSEDLSFYSRADNQLLDGRGVCAGYGHAFTYLCQMAGVPCIGIWGFVKGYDYGHAWNKVKLGESWYLVDTTWDDSATNNVGYSYFCIPDDEIEGERTPYEGLPLQNAVSSSKDYSYLNDMGMLVYDNPHALVTKGMKRVADGLKNGELEFDLYFDPKIKDEAIKLLNEKMSILLGKYGSYAKWKTSSVSSNFVHLIFEPAPSADDAVEGIIDCLKANTCNITLVSKPGVGKELKSKLLSLLKDKGYYAASATCTVKNNITTIKVTPYQTMKDISGNGIKAIVEGIRKGTTGFTLLCKKSLKKDVLDKVAGLLVENGVSMKGISAAIADTYIHFEPLGHDSAQQVIDNGMKLLADNYKKKIYTTTFIFSQVQYDDVSKKLSEQFYSKAKALGLSCKIDHWEWTYTSVTITVT